MLNSETGILRGKTRILVTNALHLLSQVDTIVLLKNGSIEGVGSYDSLLRDNAIFHELIANYASTNIEKSDDEEGGLNIEGDTLKEFPNENKAMGLMMKTLSKSNSASVSTKKEHHQSVVSQQKEIKATQSKEEVIGKCIFCKVLKLASIYISNFIQNPKQS